MRHIFYTLLSALCLSCSGENAGNSDKNVIQQEINEEKEQNFIALLKTINTSNINQYIHPENGLWLVQSSGAMPQMTNTTQVNKNFPVDFSNAEDATQAGLPQVDCGAKNFWTREGCFAANSDLFAGTQLWKHSNLSSEEKEKVLNNIANIKWSVINTALHARYYFTFINGKLYLSVVDLRVPCEA